MYTLNNISIATVCFQQKYEKFYFTYNISRLGIWTRSSYNVHKYWLQLFTPKPPTWQPFVTILEMCSNDKLKTIDFIEKINTSQNPREKYECHDAKIQQMITGDEGQFVVDYLNLNKIKHPSFWEHQIEKFIRLAEFIMFVVMIISPCILMLSCRWFYWDSPQLLNNWNNGCCSAEEILSYFCWKQNTV